MFFKSTFYSGSMVTFHPSSHCLILPNYFSFQVGGMILVVQNSKELDDQRKLFLESMSLSVGIVKPRTSSHQAIAEALDELQVCVFVVYSSCYNPCLAFANGCQSLPSTYHEDLKLVGTFLGQDAISSSF